MKKILLFLIFLFSFDQVLALNPADLLNKIPTNFKSECYEYYGKIDKSIIGNHDKKYNTYKIKTNKDNLIFTQYGFILPYKYYSDKKNNYNYIDNLGLNTQYLNDFNKKTYEELNSKTNNEIILIFNKSTSKNNFNFIFDYYSNNYYPEYFISNTSTNDGYKKTIEWNKIKKEDIEDFGFKYLKIQFKPKTTETFLENIKIYELSFPKTSNTILLKSFFNENIEIYSNFNCKEKDFNTKAKYYNDFAINNNTKHIEINLNHNPKYNVYSKKDQDNDWVEDELDNCKYRYNPDQSDINGDGIGDICSDDDNDGKIGYYDNCIYVYNPDQKDINRNGLGDVCEFDKDEDGIFDKFDNCINIPNHDQKDSDNDGIGDKCDNCKEYNPAQLDKNKNGIGDICEDNQKYLEKNDKDKDLIIDFKDNCINTPNPNQKDSDNDGIGDKCDNCINIQNTDQLDFNKNGIGDICEDSDLDGIEGIIDNCINIPNPDQKDSDNDGIGNACEDDDHDKILAINDNCPYTYNPNQKDIDKDGIGDKCDKKDNRYIESNSIFFIGLLIFIILIFGGGIFMMIKKLK